MQAFSRFGRKFFSGFRPATEPPASSTVNITRSATQDSQPVTSSISSDDARGSLGPEEGSQGDTLLPMLIGALVLSVLGIGVVCLVI